MSSTVVSVLVVSIKKGKDKGNLSSLETLSFPFYFTRGKFQRLLTVEQIFGSQWAKVRSWPYRGAVLCWCCWVLGSLLALKHNQIFTLFVAVHPTVCGRDTLVRKSFTSVVSKPHLCSILVSHMPVPSSGARIPNIPNEPSIFTWSNPGPLSLVALFKWKWHLGNVVSWLSHAWCLLLGDSLGLPAVRPYCFSLRVKGFFLFLTFSSHKGSQ